MNRKHSAVSLILILTLLSLEGYRPRGAASQPSKWDQRGEIVRVAAQVDLAQAREVAMRKVMELSDAPPGGGSFGLANPARLREVSLGEPFFYYWAGDEFEGYEDADPSALLDFMSGFTVRFPLVLDGHILGTINITRNRESGELEFNTGTVGTNLYNMFARIRRQYPASNSWKLTVVNTGLAGAYFLLEDKNGALQVSPANRFAANVLGLDPDDSHESVFVPLNSAAKSIKSTVARMRQGGSGHE